MNLLHTADLHLRDSQFGRMDRGGDFSNAMFSLIDVAIKNNCVGIIAAGDILHVKRPSSQNITDLMEMNRRLMVHNLSMWCIAGNHDECDPNWISMIEEESITQCGRSAIKDATNKVINIADTDVTMYGAPFPDMHPDDFRAQCGQWPAADILLYHGAVKEFSFYPMGDKALTLDDLPCDKYQVIALGDIHTCKYINHKDCLVGYPGPIEYCSANEGPDKSCTILRFEEKTGSLLKFSPARDIIPLHTRRVIQREVRTDSEMNTLLEDIRASKASSPIVRVWYDISINDVFTRIASIVDPCKGIIRVEPLAVGSTKKATDDIPYKHDLKPSDFVSDFFSHEEEGLHKVAMACCNADVKPGVVIDSYIDQQLSTYYDTAQF